MSSSVTPPSRVCAARHRAVQAELDRIVKAIDGMVILRPEMKEGMAEAHAIICYLKNHLQRVVQRQS